MLTIYLFYEIIKRITKFTNAVALKRSPDEIYNGDVSTGYKVFFFLNFRTHKILNLINKVKSKRKLPASLVYLFNKFS